MRHHKELVSGEGDWRGALSEPVCDDAAILSCECMPLNTYDSNECWNTEIVMMIATISTIQCSYLELCCKSGHVKWLRVCECLQVTEERKCKQGCSNKGRWSVSGTQCCTSHLVVFKYVCVCVPSCLCVCM